MATLKIGDRPPSGAATSSRSGDIRSNATPRDGERNSGPSRAWDEIPVDETPDYNELLAWGIQTMRNALFPLIWQQCLSRLNHWSRKRAQRGFQIMHACKPGMLFLCRKWLPLGPRNWTASLSWKSHSQSRLWTRSGPGYKPLSSMHWPPLHPCWRQIPRERRSPTIRH